MADERDTSYPERIAIALCLPSPEPEDYFVLDPAAPRRAKVEYVRADVFDAVCERAEKAEVVLRELCAPCTCSPAFSERGLQDPECLAGNYGDIAREGLGLPPVCQDNRADLRQDEGDGE